MSTSVKKKRNRRSSRKYPALEPEYNLKTRQDLIEADYIEQLSDAEKDWLNRFNEEYVNANFGHKGTKLQRTKKYRKDSYDRKNSRNRDIYTRVKAQGMLSQLDENLTINIEDTIINKIDRERNGEE